VVTHHPSQSTKSEIIKVKGLITTCPALIINDESVKSHNKP